MKWIDRLICLIVRHDILWGRTLDDRFVKVRCFRCDKRWDQK